MAIVTLQKEITEKERQQEKSPAAAGHTEEEKPLLRKGRYMNDRYRECIVIPLYMRGYREQATQQVRERAIAGATAQLEDGKQYTIEINTDTIGRKELNAIEIRATVEIKEVQQIHIGIDWGKLPEAHTPDRRGRGGWERSKKRRSKKRL